MTSSVVDPAALARIDQIPLLCGADRRIDPLAGGLTNENFKVTLPSGRFVARLADPSSELLRIDRWAENVNAIAASSTGISPEVIDYRPDVGILVVRWVEGRTLSEVDVGNDEMLGRIAAACLVLHSAPPFAAAFDMFSLQRQYLDTVIRRGFRLPDRYTEFMPHVDQIRSVLAVNQPAPVPCHNDLLPENFLDEDGKRLWIIDFEYSGTNDPCFELGNIASESHLSSDQLVLLVDRYFGTHQPAMIARTRLQALMSQYGWTLWGAIQQGVSHLQMDFWSWAMDKYDRAAATFTGPEFSRLLDAAAAEP